MENPRGIQVGGTRIFLGGSRLKFYVHDQGWQRHMICADKIYYASYAATRGDEIHWLIFSQRGHHTKRMHYIVEGREQNRTTFQ
jgi:hypothetical protein